MGLYSFSRFLNGNFKKSQVRTEESKPMVTYESRDRVGTFSCFCTPSTILGRVNAQTFVK
jgi:hypothetical protein